MCRYPVHISLDSVSVTVFENFGHLTPWLVSKLVIFNQEDTAPREAYFWRSHNWKYGSKERDLTSRNIFRGESLKDIVLISHVITHLVSYRRGSNALLNLQLLMPLTRCLALTNWIYLVFQKGKSPSAFQQLKPNICKLWAIEIISRGLLSCDAV
jgi:hypothetical protein